MTNPKCQYVSGVSECLLGSAPLGANRQRLGDENVMMRNSSRFDSEELEIGFKKKKKKPAQRRKPRYPCSRSLFSPFHCTDCIFFVKANLKRSCFLTNMV